eukprot:NODE_1027_length_1263_cov_407.234272.p1 GENE.NODE_1027_length_1263_cov_407.234272~~NODE_1027_length_1263_cov_407.234272.p1  ORF type:complete len:283 (-),score=68.29 NODE_1027_length_1263_cov_407.234272:255-1103(-)
MAAGSFVVILPLTAAALAAGSSWGDIAGGAFLGSPGPPMFAWLNAGADEVLPQSTGHVPRITAPPVLLTPMRQNASVEKVRMQNTKHAPRASGLTHVRNASAGEVLLQWTRHATHVAAPPVQPTPTRPQNAGAGNVLLQRRRHVAHAAGPLVQPTPTRPQNAAAGNVLLQRRRHVAHAAAPLVQPTPTGPQNAAAGNVLLQSTRHAAWSMYRAPRNIEERDMLWGLPKIVWVILADVIALAIFIVASSVVMWLAKRWRPDLRLLWGVSHKAGANTPLKAAGF